ncbi:helix-turn-helix domain-containing protein [Sabulibacter ruber]|uniref:helix-turn-helix domain-containing protein n=1 Tax=Sabulibacter ruber TaxID=2811901 RepID=UPI001A96739F|nr:helix-turn-helix domain-containing protein [Sabulibacter ruber]
MTETNSAYFEARFNKLEAQIDLLFEKLGNLTPEQEISDFNNQLLTITEAAKFLSLAKQTLYGLVQRRAIPVCKQGKRLYFPKDELTEWIRAGRKKTRSEIQAEAAVYVGAKRKRQLATA